MNVEKIGKKLKDIHTYYMGTRRRGHTISLLDGAKSNKDILVLVANGAQKQNIDLPENRMVSIDNLEMLRGRRNPLLIDHFALQSMISELLKDLNELFYEINEENTSLKLEILDLKERNVDLKRNNFISWIKRFLHFK